MNPRMLLVYEEALHDRASPLSTCSLERPTWEGAQAGLQP